MKNFYDLKYINLEYFTYFLGDLSDGFHTPGMDELEEIAKNRKYARKSNFSSFKNINPVQSKLVAVFLVNVANLLPENWVEAKQAQRALTNYWGNFLLF